MIDLESIKARHAATTPGLWAYANNQGEKPDGGWNVYVPSRGVVTRQAYREDAAFIAHAHLDVPCLVAEVEACRGVIADLLRVLTAHDLAEEATAALKAGKEV